MLGPSERHFAEISADPQRGSNVNKPPDAEKTAGIQRLRGLANPSPYLAQNSQKRTSMRKNAEATTAA